jgi:uncharacterized low-complexity protein
MVLLMIHLDVDGDRSMTNQTSKKPLALAVGTAFVTGVACTSIASAADNPFGMTELSSGYMQLAGAEGKCGGEKKEAEGKCGGEKKEAEGKCAGEKKEAEGKCGEGKCGAEKEAGEKGAER